MLAQGRCYRQKEFKPCALFLQKSRALNHRQQIQPDFFPPAAGQERDPLLFRIKMMLRGKLFARYLWRRRIGQRMSNIADFDAVLAVELLLEREDHDHLADIFLDLLDAAGTPGPYLRADEVENGNAQAVQLARQTQVEVREIEQDGGVRLAPSGFGNQMLE